MFFSGVPLAETRSDEKFAHEAAYWDYKRCTPVLLPLPCGVFGMCNPGLKAMFCCEFDMHTTRPNSPMASG
jgi:hypothetical protein